MAIIFGTLDVLSTLNAQASSQTVAKFGEDRVYQEFQRALNIHNQLMRDAISGWCDLTTDRLRRYGGVVEGELQPLDEYGTPDAQKHKTGANIGFPLRQYGYGIQWTRKFLQNASVGDLIKEMQAALTAHRKRVLRDLKTAIYTPTNKLTYEDVLVDYVVLPVRALLNGDGTPIPINPYNGASFNVNSHTHFLYATSLTNSAVQGLIDTVREHGVVGQIVVEIPESAETAFRALTDFIPMLLANVELGGGSTTTITPGALTPNNTSNRKIGVFKQAEVWVKSSVPAVSSSEYWIACRDTGKKPIAMRYREGSTPFNFAIGYENETYPLRSRVMEDEFGFGANDREGAAILYVKSGISAYAAPTIT